TMGWPPAPPCMRPSRRCGGSNPRGSWWRCRRRRRKCARRSGPRWTTRSARSRRSRSSRWDSGTRTFRRPRTRRCANCSPARRGSSAPPEESPMARIADSTILEAVGRTADPLDELVPDYTPLMRRIGDARFPLLGEASHGTHEFYRERARITKRLIEQHDVLAVAIEGDWPDAARVNRYVRGAGDDAHADDALADFRRFPTWMWRNTEVVEFVEWLRLHNEALPPDAPRVGFYGLDLY